VTFFADLSGTDAHADLVLALRIEGVPVALVERAIPAASAPALSGYTQFVGVTRVEEGEAALDLEERREMGATLDVEVLDDDAGTLSALFAVNTRRRTWASADALVGATTLTVQSTTGLANGQTIYSDSETITIGTVASGTSLTGCTRGAFGSTAAALFGAAGDGDAVYTVPPSWVARRAYLYGYTLTADGRADEQLLGVWIVDEAPRCTGDGLWSLRFAGVAQEIYGRSVGVGLREAKPTGAVTFGTSSGRQTATFTVDDSTGFRLGSLFPTYVLIEYAGDEGNTEFTICELQAVALPPGTQTITVYLDGTPWAPAPRTTSNGASKPASAMRPIAFVGGGPQALLYVLTSKEGQAATSFDRLPGRATSSPYNAPWRLGAGLTTAEVDTASFSNLYESRTSMMIIDDERSVSDLLREWCLLNGTATRITSDGKLSTFSLAPQRVAATTIGPDDVIPDSRIEVHADETALMPLAHVECSYNPFTRDHGVELNLIDTSLAKRYARNQARRELEFRSIGCSDGANIDPEAPPFSHPAALPAGEIATIAADIMRGDNGLARRYVSLSLTMAHLDLRIGDVVTLSQTLPTAFSTLPDLRGGTIVGKRARVVARRPRYDSGRVDVRLLILDNLLVVAPAATITVVVGTTLTLSTTEEEVSGVFVANDFIAGAAVRIYDVSGAAVHLTTVSSILSNTQLVVAAAPPFAIQAGVDYIALSPAASTVGGTSFNGYSMTEFATVTSDAGTITASNSEVTTSPRWR
jgi:hypothetical protein